MREIFRHIEAWRALYEVYGLDTLPPDFGSWTLWDIEYLIEEGVPRLTEQQSTAIRLYLLKGMKESDVADAMGIPTSPIGKYATAGITSLLRMMDRGELPLLSEGAA